MRNELLRHAIFWIMFCVVVFIVAIKANSQPKWCIGKINSKNTKIGNLLFYDKASHFIRDAFVTGVVGSITHDPKMGLIAGCGLSVIWEIKDSLLWQHYDPDKWYLDHVADPKGGEVLDVLAGIAGSIATYLVMEWYYGQ